MLDYRSPSFQRSNRSIFLKHFANECEVCLKCTKQSLRRFMQKYLLLFHTLQGARVSHRQNIIILKTAFGTKFKTTMSKLQASRS